jgi:tetratricopeptide (TPR) repeat protein
MAFFKKKINTDNPKELWEDFFKVVMKNEWKTALEMINALKQLEPNNPQVHMKLGDILQRTGDAEGSIPAYHDAANCLIADEDYSKAIAIYKIILRLNPKDQDAIARSQELMGGAVPAQPQEHMTYEEVSDQEGGEGDQEYNEEAAEGEAADEGQAEYQEEPQEEEQGAYLGNPDEDDTYQGTYDEQAAQPTQEDTYEEQTEGATDAISDLYDAPDEALVPESAPALPADEEPVAEEATAPEPEAPKQVQPAEKTSTSLHDAFKRHPMFNVLSDDDIDLMIKKARHAVFQDGQAVITEDEPGDSMFIIKKGKASVTSTMFDKTYDLATLGGGNFFGEVGFLTGMPRTASVISKGGLSIMEINKPLMQELIERNPKVLQKLVELSHSRTKKKRDQVNE